MKFTNKHNLPEAVYRALTHSNYSRGDSNRSVTQLIDSPRIRILKSEHSDDVTTDVSDMIWAVLGTAIHTMFEDHAGEGNIAEQRLFADVNGWTVSGAIDLQTMSGPGVNVQDYKSTSVWSIIYGPKLEWEQQLNFYAWLVEQNSPETEVKGLQVIALLRDWKQRDAEMKSDYPNAPIVVVDIPLWTKREREEYVQGRVKIHQEAEFNRLTGNELPLCTPLERWQKSDTYAVKKGKNKRAVKVFQEYEEAQLHIDMLLNGDPAYWVEERPGEATRCAKYCAVADYCEQYQEELKNAAV